MMQRVIEISKEQFEHIRNWTGGESEWLYQIVRNSKSLPKGYARMVKQKEPQESEDKERSVNEGNATWLIGKMKSDINGIRYSHMFDYVSRERILDTVIEIIDKYTKGEGE